MGPELLVGKVLAWFVVVWHLLWVLGFPLVAQAALVQLGATFLLVGQAAHLLSTVGVDVEVRWPIGVLVGVVG